MNTPQYLDAAKAKLGIESDYALAKRLGMTRFGISKLRRRVVVMTATVAAQVAEILGIDPLKVIADAEIERGRDREIWTRIRDAAMFAFGVVGGAVIAAQMTGADLTISKLLSDQPARIMLASASEKTPEYTLYELATLVLAALGLAVITAARRAARAARAQVRIS